jgi:hypothetical protein
MTSPQEEKVTLPTDAPLVYGPGGIMGVPGPSVGRVPLPVAPNVVFAGSANGESLWALPSSQSPEASSDSASGSGQPPVSGVPPGTDDLMADIDWVSLIFYLKREIELMVFLRMRLMLCFPRISKLT